MRLFSSSIALGALALAALSRAAFINLPTLYSCEPATIQVTTSGNYTIEGRDADTRKLVFRAHVNKGVSSVNWTSVDLPANATALVTVIDQLAPGKIASGAVQGFVQPNPTGNTTCLSKDQLSKQGRDHHRNNKQRNMVPTIVGIVIGAFFLLVLLLVGGMMYRRRKERMQKVEQDSVDLNHSYAQGSVPAGGSYMAHLVPGLRLQEARPLPRDPVLESEQANYASTRRGTQYYHNGAGLDSSGGRSAYNHRSTQQPWQPPQPTSRSAGEANPFSSHADLASQSQPSQQNVYQHADWERSQTSFLSHNKSRS